MPDRDDPELLLRLNIISQKTYRELVTNKYVDDDAIAVTREEAIAAMRKGIEDGTVRLMSTRELEWPPISFYGINLHEELEALLDDVNKRTDPPPNP